MVKVNFKDNRGNHYVENAFKQVNVFTKSGKLLKTIKRGK